MTGLVTGEGGEKVKNTIVIYIITLFRLDVKTKVTVYLLLLKYDSPALQTCRHACRLLAVLSHGRLPLPRADDSDD